MLNSIFYHPTRALRCQVLDRPATKFDPSLLFLPRRTQHALTLNAAEQKGRSMSRNGYRPYQIDEVPEAARHDLEKAQKKFGFVPNLLRFMAESPATLHGYLTLDGIFASTSLSLREQTVVILSASVENGCRYCMAAHSTQGLMQGIGREIIHAIRTGDSVPDPRFDALRNMVRDLIHKRGCVSEPDVRAFLEAGFTREQLLETVVGIAVKTISNYTNHIVDTPLDSVFAGQKVEEAS